MITFTEKEQFNASFWTGNTPLIPVFMVKDGAEYFVINRHADIHPDDNSLSAVLKNETYTRAKSMLLSNGGMYFLINGRYKDPFELIKVIKSHGFTFTEPENIFNRCDGEAYGGGFDEFHGSINEYSMSFHYRIYDEELLRQLKAELETIGVVARKSTG